METAKPDDVKHLVSSLQKAHRADLIGKDAKSQDLRELVHSMFTLALAGPAVFEVLADQTPLVVELKAILAGHENKDVLSDVLRLVGDLTDPDAYEGDDRQRALKLVNRVMDTNLSSAVIDLLEKHDGALLLDCVRVLTNICEIYPTAGAEHLAGTSSLMNILLELVRRKPGEMELEESLAVSELLSMITHESESARQQLETEQSMESLLSTMAIWKRTDPKFPEEQEWCENVHSVVRRVLMNRPSAKQVFMKLDGVELALKLLKGESLNIKLALKLLRTCAEFDRVLSERIIESGGLKLVFPVLMGLYSVSKKQKLEGGIGPVDEAVWAALGLLSALTLNLDGMPWVRVSAKFTEPGKFERLVELHLEALMRVNNKIMQLEEEGADDLDEDEEYLELMDGGLDMLQEADMVIARLLREPSSSDKLRRVLLLSCGSDEDELKEALLAIKKVVSEQALNLLVLNADGSENGHATMHNQSRLIDFASFEQSTTIVSAEA